VTVDGRLRAAAAWLALSALAGATAGCSVLPFRSTARPAPAPAPREEAAGTAAADSGAAVEAPAEPDSASRAVAVAESLLAQPGEATDTEAEDVPEETSEPPSPEVVAPAPRSAPPEATEPPPPAPDPEASDQVTVQISDDERAELEARARESLRDARRVIRTIDRSSLSAERLEKLAAAESLVEQARAAFDGDVRAAATLAHKASVLLAELTAN
jgi:hypothetical protein